MDKVRPIRVSEVVSKADLSSEFLKGPLKDSNGFKRYKKDKIYQQAKERILARRDEYTEYNLNNAFVLHANDTIPETYF